ncbi:MAG: TonB-dependent receptor [Bacteroidetes bacterium]|nr:TonB-dependent receptor [Bacteroidota bacterium]
MRSIFITWLFLLVVAVNSFSQDGFIRGTVFDAANGESLPGVSVVIEGTTIGTITDLDGKFNIKVAPGNCNLSISYISYQAYTIKDILVKSGEVTVVNDIGLQEVTFELSEVVIAAQAVRNNENALLTIKRKSANVVDGISAAGFRKMGDSDAASSMKRVPGISVEGGKYVYVRGLGDRYTKTVLNEIDIPGLDPDRNTLQMDLFPTNVIDNIIVHKSFNAKLPADFTGGIIDIETKDFPEEKKGNVSLNLGYNPSMHFNSNYLTYEGGKTDFLGFDDGTRAIPATSNIPFFSEAVGNPDGPKGQRYREILNDFNPHMAAYKEKSFMDWGFGFSFGNQKPGKRFTFGYNLALSYKNETEYYKDAEFGRYGLSGDKSVYEMEIREFQKGDYGVSNILWSGLAGLAIKTKNSKYRLNLLHLQNGESKAGIFDYRGSDQGSNFYGFQHNLDYSERSLTNLLLDGKHAFPEKRWEVEWKLSPTLSKIQDPDIRFTRYEDRDGKWSIGTEVGFPERLWRDLEEFNMAGIAHITKNFDIMGQGAKVEFGGAYTYKQREFEVRTFALNIRDIPLTGNPDELFFDYNIWPYFDGTTSYVTRGTTFDANFVPTNPNKFNSSVNNIAGYVSFEASLFTKLRAILGVRFENYVQRYTGQNQLGNIVLNDDVVLDNIDFFPAINLIYNLTEKQNLRAGYSKTIARPSFKELSYAEIYDPVSGRTFIGGLFRDADDVRGLEYWDGNLTSTNIHNYDLRWELFFENGQMFSLSAFYKQFIRPIEIVQYATLVGSFQPRNVGDGQVYGAEAEMRLSLGNIAKTLENFSILFNFTYTHSSIKLSSTEYNSRVENARTGENIDKYRVMAGQAPYIVNGGLSYNGGENGFWNGFEAGLYYNVQGQTLQYVGIVDRPDIYTVPFHSLNFNSSKKFGKDNRMQIGLKIDNILNDDKELISKSYKAEDQPFTKLSPGTAFKISFSYSFF